MICSSGIGFDPVHAGERLKFGFHGIWQGTAVLYDRKTQSLWLHVTGECFKGRRKGITLTPIPGRHVLWREWKSQHPKTQVMASNKKFKKHYFSRVAAFRGRDHFPPYFELTIKTRDKRLPLASLLYGVRVDGQAVAYPFSRLRGVSGGIVHETIGNTAIAVVYDAETGSCTAMGRTLDGQVLTFKRRSDGNLESQGSVFDRGGRCIEGQMLGKRLPKVFGLQAEWYGWYAAYPQTKIWQP